MIEDIDKISFAYDERCRQSQLTEFLVFISGALDTVSLMQFSGLSFVADSDYQNTAARQTDKGPKWIVFDVDHSLLCQ